MKNFVRLASVVSFASLAACGVTPSEDLNTSGIHALMSATVTGDGSTYVSASLFNGNPLRLIFVELSADDRLVAHHDTDTETLVETQLLTLVSHGATFEGDAAEQTFEIDFERGDTNEDAMGSTATIPAPFTLDPAPTTASRAAELAVSWQGTAPEPMSWSATGPCIKSASGTVEEDTAVTIPANAFAPSNPAMPMTCDVTVTIARVRAGDLASAFGGGAMSGRQERSFVVSSTP